jgi:hypothetical protein
MPYSRSLSLALRRQIFTPYRDADIRVLVMLEHVTFAEPYRFVCGDPNEFATLTSNGEEFQTFPFELVLLNDDESEPQAGIRIQNADDRIGSTIRELPDDAVAMTIQIVMRETPDVVEYEATNLELVDVEETATLITGRIVARGAATEPCPGRKLTGGVSPVMVR